MTIKLPVTCTCGQPIPRKLAARVLAAGRKDNSEHMRAISMKGVEARKVKKLSTQQPDARL